MAWEAKRWARIGAMLLALGAVAGAGAAPEEIQVYLDDKEAPGGISVDWHNNYVLSGRSSPAYPGEQPPAEVYRLTPELNVGLTDTLEYGLYVLTSRNREGDWHANGVKMRLKYIAPHDEKQGLFWGVNIEAGKSDLAIEPYPWNAELKGIVGTHSGPWTFGLNLNLDSSLDRHAGPVDADIDIKVNYALTAKTQLGVESYNELGPLSHFDAWSRNGKTIFAVVDTEVAGLALDAGLGRGTNGNSDRWTLKFILNTPF
ncbi:MAG: hypothetical protein JO224_06625 [Pelomonas sp.]|nr:hypothetical protein [Roseateles sp.]